jgi:sporulation protein YlmC with PRC-barrel domain
LITDIVVEFEDGSIANVEIQKIGYMFPGQRAACYSSDLLLRQYKRLRSEKDEVFTYKKIKTVYTIVLIENTRSVILEKNPVKSRVSGL